ncbi:MAG: FitA-like ribbon-helix-helix domain-containing protein [Micromonosporaceae bacterium]
MAILQVRDVPDDVMAELRQRAKNEGVSLSAYVRGLLIQDVGQPTMAEVIAEIATHEPVDVTGEEILAAIHEGRR